MTTEKPEFISPTTIYCVGTSLAIRVPADLVKLIGLKPTRKASITLVSPNKVEVVFS